MQPILHYLTGNRLQWHIHENTMPLNAQAAYLLRNERLFVKELCGLIFG